MQTEIKHLTTADLEAGLDEIRRSPKEQGVLELIVSRPEEDAREVMELADLDTELGLVGDTWQDRPSGRSADGMAHPDMQITIMNSRVALCWPRTRSAGRCPATSCSRTWTSAKLTCPPVPAYPWVRPSWKPRTSPTPAARNSPPGSALTL